MQGKLAASQWVSGDIRDRDDTREWLESLRGWGGSPPIEGRPSQLPY